MSQYAKRHIPKRIRFAVFILSLPIRAMAYMFQRLDERNRR